MLDTHLPKEFTATALIVTATLPKQALLLHSKKHDLWMPPGGHVEFYESPFEAVVREASEETGLDITPYLPTPVSYDENRTEVPLPMRITEIHLTHGGREHYHVDFMYRIEVPEALSVRRDDTESLNIGWFNETQLDELTIPADILPILKQELAK